MTPAELKFYADAYVGRLKLERECRQVDIYNLAALIRVMVWAKHPPRYETAFPDRSPKEAMTDDQMFETVKALNALFGGEEV